MKKKHHLVPLLSVQINNAMLLPNENKSSLFGLTATENMKAKWLKDGFPNGLELDCAGKWKRTPSS